MHGPADLLVEKDVPREDADGVVEPEGQLADAPGAVVERDHLAQELLAARSRRVDDLSLVEAQAHVVDLAGAEDGRERERDLALRAVVERGGEDLAVGEVLVAVGQEPAPALAPDGEGEVGPL